MRYQALYRKYRPQRFADVIGQDHVTQTLAREVVDGKVAHAYLFAGPRGTGKTTTARLLAKALNCANRGADGEPCNQCPSCAGITTGSSLDVIELDAASHNKVDDVREIRINVGTVAAGAGAMRVYILDEAHMLSRAAGNALLKTLEEPPEHVVFVLATTEPYKLLDTIRSRAQRFDFHQVAAETLTNYLAAIGAREGFTTRPDGLAQIAVHARGSVRDALSLLEQVAALGGGEVDASGVTRALGLADDDAFGALIEAISDQDAPKGLGIVARLAAEGADLRRFAADSVGFMRGIFLAQYAPNLEEVADEPPDTLARWRKHAAVIGSADLLRAIDLFGQALTQLRDGREERLVVELTVLKATRPETALDAASLGARLDRLERLERSASIVDRSPSESPEASPSEGSPSTVDRSSLDDAEDPPDNAQRTTDNASEPTTQDAQPTRHDPQPTTHNAQLTLASFLTGWPAMVARVRSDVGARRHAYLKEANPIAVDDGVVVFEIPTHLHFLLEQLEADKELHAILSTLAEEMIDTPISLRFVAGDGEQTGDEPERAPNKDDLDVEGSDAGADPTRLVADLLGGEVVTE
jgi:DNA polymerase-3 subunit gamma/tau